MARSGATSVEPAPHEVFDAVANPVRIAILEALWNAEGHEATFVELQRAAGVDDSGRFNYHLGKLRGTLVANDDGTYRLLLSGRRTMGSLLSGEMTRQSAIEPVETACECPLCGEANLTVRYRSETAQVRCEECDVGHVGFPVPAGVFEDYDPEELPAVTERYIRTVRSRLQNGFCPTCEGRVKRCVRPAGEVFPTQGDLPTDLPFVTYECGRCGDVMTIDARTAIATEDEVVAFHHSNGIDLTERPIWELYTLDTRLTEVTGRTPFRAVVRFEAGGRTLSLTIDEELNVVEAVEES